MSEIPRVPSTFLTSTAIRGIIHGSSTSEDFLNLRCTATSGRKIDSNGQVEECAYCLEPLEYTTTDEYPLRFERLTEASGHSLLTNTACPHIFHFQCYRAIFRDHHQCPTCRIKWFDSNEDQKEVKRFQKLMTALNDTDFHAFPIPPGGTVAVRIDGDEIAPLLRFCAWWLLEEEEGKEHVEALLSRRGYDLVDYLHVWADDEEEQIWDIAAFRAIMQAEIEEFVDTVPDEDGQQPSDEEMRRLGGEMADIFIKLLAIESGTPDEETLQPARRVVLGSGRRR